MARGGYDTTASHPVTRSLREMPLSGDDAHAKAFAYAVWMQGNPESVESDHPEVSGQQQQQQQQQQLQMESHGAAGGLAFVASEKGESKGKRKRESKGDESLLDSPLRSADSGKKKERRKGGKKEDGSGKAASSKK